MPFLMSRWRWPSTCRSTVSTSALHLAAARALDQRADEAAVLHDVELEPERLVDRRRDVLDRADRHGRQRERNAGRLRGAAGEDLAVAVLHAAQPDRRQRERQRDRLAEDGGRGARCADVDQHALAQLDALRGRRGWRAASPRHRSRRRHSRRTPAAPCGGRPAAGPRCRSWCSWLRSPALSRGFDSTKPSCIRRARWHGTAGPCRRRYPRADGARERGRVPAVGIGKNADNGRNQRIEPIPRHEDDFERRSGRQAPTRAGREAARRRSTEALDRGLEETLSRLRPGLGHPAAAKRRTTRTAR